jgi:uncharacterized membrane protein YccC
MSDVPRLVSGAEREARRELLQEALERLAAAPDPHAGAQDVMRALDAYLDAHHPGSVVAPREPPVTDFSRSAAPAPRRSGDVSPALWIVLATAVVATVVVAIVLSGGWPAGLAIIAIWVVALLVLTQTS